MNYNEAVKKVQTRKVKENFILVTLSYDNKILLPYKDGIAFMAALESAERFHDPYNAQHRIGELDKNQITSSLMSHEEYERYKIAALLGMTVEAVKEAALQTD